MNNENNPSSEKKKKLKVAFYIRLSTEDQKEMYGEALQLASLEWLLKSREYDLEFAWKEYIYKDLKVSGSLKIEDRPWMKQMFNDLQYWKPFDVVLVYKIDRFARSLKVLLEVVDKLKDYQIDFISSLESIDTSSHFWKAMLWILWVFAELEKDMNQEKMSAWLLQSVLSWNKINDVYWYDRYEKNKINHFKINSTEEKVVKSIFEDYTSPRTLGDLWYITKRLIKERAYTPWVAKKLKSGKNILEIECVYKWSNWAVQRILEDEVYIWVYYYWKTKSYIDKNTGKRVKEDVPMDKWVEADEKHISIIGDTIYEKAQHILKSSKKSSHNNKHTKEWNIYIFTWLLKCDSCKWHKTDGWLYHWIWEPSHWLLQYKCKWTHIGTGKVCKTIPIQTEDLDRIILWEIKKIIQNPPALKKYVKNQSLIEKEKEKLNEELESINTKIIKFKQWQKNIYKLLKLWDIDGSQYKRDYDDLEDKINKNKQQSDEIHNKLQWEFELDDYLHTFKVLSDILTRNLEEILQDKLKAQKLIQYLIDEIIVYSKDNNWEYRLSWRKKEWQQIPYRVEVKLKLPQVFLNEFLTLNNINNDDIAWEYLWKKVEAKEKEIEEDKNKKWKWWGKWSWGWWWSTYEKATNTLKNIKKDLMNNIILVKQQFSPFDTINWNSISSSRTGAIFC